MEAVFERGRGALRAWTAAAALLAASAGAHAQEVSVDDWAADLLFLVERLETIHPDPFGERSRESFQMDVNELLDRLPALESHAVRAELMRLVASLGDGHTNVWPSGEQGLDHWFPVRLRRYVDGVFVEAVAAEHAELAGAEVLEVGALDARAALSAAASVASGDNGHHRLYQAPFYLASAEVLHALGVVADRERLPLTVRHVDGRTEEVVLEAVTAPFDGDWFFGTYFGIPGGGEAATIVDASEAPPPLHRRRARSQALWFEHVPEDDLFYVRINLIRDTPEETFHAFTERMWAACDRAAAGVFVVDVRHCGGGNNQLLLPLLHGFIRRDAVNRPGRLFAVVGPPTFSAAMSLVVDLERHTHAVLAGEPTGGSVKEFAEVVGFELPASRLWVNVSRFAWQHSVPWDRRTTVVPELAAPVSSRDARANRDPALEAILRRAGGG